jgi:hypothetical protein
MRSGWNSSAIRERSERVSGSGAACLLTPAVLSLLVLSAAPTNAQKGVPMTPDRLDSLTQGRTMNLRSRNLSLTQILPAITQQMLYRTRLTPEAPDLPLSVFCSGAKLSQLEHAITTLFGYRLLGRSQGEGMGLVFVPDPQAIAAAGKQRLQGRAAVETGIARALVWLKQPASLGEIARTRCPAASSLQSETVRRAFALHAALTAAQRAIVLSGHPVLVPYASLPATGRSILPGGPKAPRWLIFYLYTNPWSSADSPRLAVRAEPSGQTWLSSPPLDLVPAHFPASADTDPAFKTRLSGAPELDDLEPGEEGPAILEWMADQSKVWIMSEGLRPGIAGAESLKKFAASCSGLTLEEGLDRVAAYFGATWQYSDGWVLLKRRSNEGLEAASQSASSRGDERGRRG